MKNKNLSNKQKLYKVKHREGFNECKGCIVQIIGMTIKDQKHQGYLYQGYLYCKPIKSKCLDGSDKENPFEACMMFIGEDILTPLSKLEKALYEIN